MGTRVTRITVELIALWLACVSVCGQSAPTKDVLASVLELAAKCSNNPLLGAEHAANIKMCAGSLDLKVRFQCLSFLDVNSRLCALKESVSFNLSERIRSEASKPLNIETMCANTEAFTFAPLLDYPEYFSNIQKFLANQAHCVKLCASDNFTEDTPNFFCRAFLWGLNVIKDVKQAQMESNVNLLHPKIAEADSPNNPEVSGQAPRPGIDASKIGDNLQVLGSDKTTLLNVNTGNSNVETSHNIVGSEPDHSESKLNNIGTGSNIAVNRKEPELAEPRIIVEPKQGEITPLNSGSPSSVGALLTKGIKTPETSVVIKTPEISEVIKTPETSEVRPPASSGQETINHGVQPEPAGQSDSGVNPLDTIAQSSLNPVTNNQANPSSQIAKDTKGIQDVRDDNALASDNEDYDGPGTGEDSQFGGEDPEHPLREDQVPQTNPKKNVRVSNAISTADDYLDNDGGPFFPVFFTGVVLMVLLYILYHNKNKVMGLLIEGRQPGGRRRNSRGHAYRRLDTLEQAISANAPGATPSKIIY